jgi:hypothetical protein
MKKLLLASALGLMGLASTGAHADSQLVVGAGSAAARLDFRVVIPRVLFLGVGTGATAATPATVNTVDRISFDYSTNAAAVGTGAAAASITNTGPVPAGATLPVKVIGNNGQVVLTATNPATLVSTTVPADTIPFSQITATSSLVTVGGVPAPALSGGTSNVILTSGTKVTNAGANWTFAFANTAVVPAGTYDGRVTYTAAMP